MVIITHRVRHQITKSPYITPPNLFRIGLARPLKHSKRKVYICCPGSRVPLKLPFLIPLERRTPGKRPTWVNLLQPVSSPYRKVHASQSKLTEMGVPLCRCPLKGSLIEFHTHACPSLLPLCSAPRKPLNSAVFTCVNSVASRREATRCNGTNL